MDRRLSDDIIMALRVRTSSTQKHRAPRSIERVESLIAPIALGNGKTVYNVSDELLEALYDAYIEANKHNCELLQREDSYLAALRSAP